MVIYPRGRYGGRWFVFFGVFLMLGLSPLAGQTRDLRLIPGSPAQGSLEYTVTDMPSQRYRISIPSTAYGVRFSLSGARADLDLALFNENEELVVYSETERYNEELYLSRLNEPRIEPGVYWIEVSYQWNKPPAWEGRSRQLIPYTLTMDIIRPESRSMLQPGQPVHGSLEPGSGMMAAYEVTVPRGTRTLRIDLNGSQADADLYVFIGGLRADPYEAEYQSRSYSSTEWLVLDAQEDRTIRYGIMVLAAMDDVGADFTLEASLGDQAPARLLSYPALPRGDQFPGTANPGDLTRQLYATVELLDEFGGGSGCIVSPDGLILTNYHVVEASHLMGTEVLVSLSLDHRFPPQELFKAGVVAVDPARDIALLRITSGLYGQPLPDPLNLPYLSLGNPDDLTLGEELTFIGYPRVGSLGTRTTITLSRGVVSGFENRGDFGAIIKTDGEINAGNSGGAALNHRGDLVGMPTQVVRGSSEGRIAFVYPVSLLPEDWVTMITGSR
ncbi:S1C family serine protease [Spirochaeta lutea]|uniref:Uncharacterized protein n=1 Tax=Spirochaeta lutea TaxID=1480694 RepID=A0A098QTQ0_9SPIO|nr:trypsin-like peptidase domain-containing protein [Spirochaeta lutea]KGE71255.1 hypothetical protein DC28_12470 [Spirochaeta lutea]